MTKFSVDRFPPGFFELSRDVARALPMELIERWTRCDQSVEAAFKLLDPARVECAVVCTDSSGLTRLTRARGLIEILAMINRPKEIVHAWGTAAGGAAVGLWAADNTEMFYPPCVKPETILSMLLSVMVEIQANCEVWIGAAVHWGQFFLLSDGLYGIEASRVEDLAEDIAGPSEVLITPEFASLLSPDHKFTLTKMEAIAGSLGPVYRLDGGPCANDLMPEDIAYPVPYSPEFYADLKTFGTKTGTTVQMEELRRRYCQTRAVVLIEREREEGDILEVAILNDLALSAAMGHLAANLLQDTGGKVVKISGPLGIFTFTECAPAVEFARRFRDAFLARGIRSRIGVDVGDVLVFELGGGLIDLAGMPVNIASKMAQDAGMFGKIYLTEAALHACPARENLSPLQIRFGELTVDAWVE